MYLQPLARKQIDSKGNQIRLAYISSKVCDPPEWWGLYVELLPEKVYQAWYLLEIPANFLSPDYISDVVRNVFDANQIQLNGGKWLVSEYLEDPPRNLRNLVKARIRMFWQEAIDYPIERLYSEQRREMLAQDMEEMSDLFLEQAIERSSDDPELMR
jgi:hypothetical protein